MPLINETYNQILTRGLKSQLSQTPVVDGKIRFVTDDQELYIDYQNSRIKISDIILGYTSAQILAISSPITNKFYFASDTLVMYKHNGITWNTVSAGNAQTLEGHSASYFATADHEHSEYLTVDSPLAAANLTGTIADGVTAVTQAEFDNSTKVATTLYADRAMAAAASWKELEV